MSRLEAYLALEREMLRLDEAGDEYADALRDAMDPLWHLLGPEERAFLNGRTIPDRIEELEPIHGACVASRFSRDRAIVVDSEPFHSSSWGVAA